jgi:hypothetical protein
VAKVFVDALALVFEHVLLAYVTIIEPMWGVDELCETIGVRRKRLVVLINLVGSGMTNTDWIPRVCVCLGLSIYVVLIPEWFTITTRRGRRPRADKHARSGPS